MQNKLGLIVAAVIAVWFGLVIQDKNEAIGTLEQRVAAAKLEIEHARAAV